MSDDVSDEAWVLARLKKLRQELGLWQPTAAKKLGSGLRRLWGIPDDADRHAVLNLVAPKFYDAFGELKLSAQSSLSLEQVQLIAAVAFNLKDIGKARESGLDDRRKWLQDHSQPRITYGQSRKAEDNHILPALAKRWAADWREFAPGEPFPVDDESTLGQESSQAAHVKSGFKVSKRLVVAISLVAVLALVASLFFVIRGGVGEPDAMQNPSRNLIVATATTGSSLDLGFSIAFPRGRVDDAKRYVTDYLEMSSGARGAQSLFVDTLLVGGYAYEGVTVGVNLGTDSDREVNVYNIRPIIHKKEDIVLGSVVHIPGAAGPPQIIYYELGKPNYVPRSGSDKGPPFFTTQHIGLTRSAPQSVLLMFASGAAAHEFGIAIDYEVDGQKLTQMVRQAKDAPDLVVRATGGLCSLADSHSPGEIARLRQMGYEQVFRNAGPYDVEAPLVGQIPAVDPRAFVEHNCE